MNYGDSRIEYEDIILIATISDREIAKLRMVEPDCPLTNTRFIENVSAEASLDFLLENVDGNARLVAGDAVTEIARLRAEDGGPMRIGGATLAAAAMRAGLIDEYVLATAPVLVGGGTPFFTALDHWVNLSLVEIRTFPDGVVLTRYETRR